MEYARQRWKWLNDATPSYYKYVLATITDERIIQEQIIYSQFAGKAVALPFAAVADLVEDKISALRVYYGLWPIFQSHQVRKRILKPSHDLAFPWVIQCYQQALRNDDM